MSTDSSSNSDPAAKDLPDDLGGVAGLLDIDLVETGPERVTATMPVTAKHHQPFGVLHGGVSVVLAETVASIGAYLAAPEGHTAVGMEVNANHVRSVQKGRVAAVATPLHTGRTTHVWSVKIHHEGEKLICVSRCTLAIVQQESASSS
ncbi:hotdog fold thioesterase [Salinibacter sp. 10B]|uniref:hotdog fold thioesterase n=1 Tax=Salinibacter sp. 10B TaxID=1923971 RepID=UPI000CF4953C|nr:hotdog fold thioesterase [Salinibacter sp. 10B]